MFRRTWLVRVLTAAAMLMVAGGCGGGVDDEQAGRDLDALQSRIVSETEDAVQALEDAGLTVERAAGIAEYCQTQPAPGVTYRAGGVVTEQGDPADQVAMLRDALTDLGWTVDTEGTDPTPFANLTRDDLRLAIAVSRRQDEPGTTFGITGPCIEVSESDFLHGDDRRTELVGQVRATDIALCCGPRASGQHLARAHLRAIGSAAARLPRRSPRATLTFLLTTWCSSAVRARVPPGTSMTSASVRTTATSVATPVSCWRRWATRSGPTGAGDETDQERTGHASVCARQQSPAARTGRPSTQPTRS